MTQNTTVAPIEVGGKFTAFDLYNMSDVTADNDLYADCVQYCEFLGWHPTFDDTIRVKDVLANKEFWTVADDVIVLAQGWVIPDMSVTAELAVAS